MKYIYIWLVFCALSVTSCNSYLDTVPESDIQTVETIFEKRENVDRWLQTCYVLLSKHLTSIPANPDRMGTDEVVAGEYCRQFFETNNWNIKVWEGLMVADGLQMSQEPYGNVWKRDLFYAGIRYCNIFLEKIGLTYNMEQTEKTMECGNQGFEGALLF